MRAAKKQKGFTIVEMLISTAAFLLIAGAAFSLLGVSQQRYQTDSQILSSFQDARLAMDQITRDVDDSGYLPQNHFSVLPAANLYAATPVAWSPNYPGTACTIGGSCTSPSAFDLIIETDIDPQNNNGLEWVRYQLPAGSTTMLRGVVSKTVGADPVTATSATGVMIPYLQNVMNNGTTAQIAAIQAAYPAMFPGGTAVPIFTYVFDGTKGSAPSCLSYANSPCNVRDVEITLIVQALSPDAKTGQLRLVELHGRGHRVNPNI
jgi:prepilin-type N-terminal cleavage/methylation domain-containing protein